MPGGCSLTEEELEDRLQLTQRQQAASTSDVSCSATGGDSTAGRVIPDRTVDPSSPLGTWSRAQTQRQKALRAGDCAGTHDAASTSAACRKCGAPAVLARPHQTDALCADCLEAMVTTKLRAATRARGLLLDSECIMVALSGGVSSMVLLHALLCIRSAPDVRHERGKVRFDLTAVHVDESAPRGLTPAQAAAHRAELRAAVAEAGFTGPLLIVPLHAALGAHAEARGGHRATAAYSAAAAGAAGDASHGQDSSSSSSIDAEARLSRLLGSVDDVTGREDLASALRRRLLLATAAAHGCTKLATGENASVMAVRIIADAAKGRGHSLAADIQCGDARAGWARGAAAATSGASDTGPTHVSLASPSQAATAGAPAPGVVVLHPLREVSGQEVAALHVARRLPLAEPPPAAQTRGAGGAAQPLIGGVTKASINTLAADFVGAMQQSLPSSVFTVLRAASHLTPFPFTDPAVISRRADGRHDSSVDGDSAGDEPLLFCAICDAPVAGVDHEWWREHSGSSTSDGRSACYSCRNQLLGAWRGSGHTVEGGLSRAASAALQHPPAAVLEQLLCEMGEGVG